MATVFMNGSFVPDAEARISIRTNALHYGTGLFEGIRGYWNAERGELYVFRLREHCERFVRNARVLRLSLPYPPATLADLTVELCRRNRHREDIYIRPIAFIASEGLAPKLLGYETTLAIYTLPLGEYIDTQRGLRVMVSSWRRLEDTMIPARCKITGGYVNSALATTEALEAGLDEAILLNQDGHVSEGAGENIFLVRDGVLITPPQTANILEGITRDAIIRLAREELGLEVMERTVDRTELYVADEVFFCGTGAQVSPIVEVDRRPVGDGKVGPITAAVQALYFRVVRGEVPRYLGWCTPVYGPDGNR